MKLLITGGAGFIGSAVVRFLIEDTDWYDLHFVENLLNQMIVNKCDIGVGKIIKVHEDGSIGKIYGFDFPKVCSILEAQKYDLTSRGVT